MVLVGINDSSKQKVAIKMIDKATISVSMQRKLQLEIAAMKRLDHPSIIKLFDVIDQKDKLCMIIEFCQGGDLLDLITRSEKVCSFPIIEYPF